MLVSWRKCTLQAQKNLSNLEAARFQRHPRKTLHLLFFCHKNDHAVMEFAFFFGSQIFGACPVAQHTMNRVCCNFVLPARAAHHKSNPVSTIDQQHVVIFLSLNTTYLRHWSLIAPANTESLCK